MSDGCDGAALKRAYSTFWLNEVRKFQRSRAIALANVRRSSC
eukprot:CAMPEP_0119538730 /NCGR_PEP_ID=MMETSP1344-20130328/51090_1 /TAXON_ID=236787 /ORGANISM="Florenciella parvula, Strain CCMP2471" /LENGTH=41 /DNA_ID= /DNA_START= /DNA_END= /DNA_ORIENTATION=